jgi:hypothetical protein
MGDIEHNRAILTALVRRAAAGGARIAVLPECAVTGYMDPGRGVVWTAEAPGTGELDIAGTAEPVPGPSTAHFAALAKELGLYLVVPLAEKAGKVFHNSSRYGVAKTLAQGYGRCWDFSDVFVTLSRASGVPARQVAGWLYGESGHVWAEVLINGTRWRQVDPTAADACDADYIPWFTTEDGDMPIVYLSMPAIEVRDTASPGT